MAIVLQGVSIKYFCASSTFLPRDEEAKHFHALVMKIQEKRGKKKKDKRRQKNVKLNLKDMYNLRDINMVSLHHIKTFI